MAKLVASNDLVESLIRGRTLRPLSNQPERTFRVKGSLPFEIRTAQSMLRRLHDALVETNKEGGGHINFGINLTYKHSSTAKRLRKFKEVRLRSNAYVFRLQAHQEHNHERSTLLFAETVYITPPSSPRGAKNPAGKQYDRAPSILNLAPPDKNANTFAIVGDFASREAPSDQHRLYLDMSHTWAPIRTLTDLFNCKQNAPDLLVRFRLAALVAVSHLQFMMNPDLQDLSQSKNYRYYDYATEVEPLDEPAIIRDESRLLSPYLFSGFGSSPDEPSTREFGSASDATPMYDPQTVDLGILLYEVGRWQTINLTVGTTV